MTPGHTTLPHGNNDLFVTDGGLETTLVFHEGYDLPCFAAFDLLKDAGGTDAILYYYRKYLNIAAAHETGFILESPTWRSNPDWMARIGYPVSAIADINQKAIDLMFQLRAEYAGRVPAIVVSGCIGPRGDGYKPGSLMRVEEAQQYHMQQPTVFAASGVDMISAITMNYMEEAIGIANAAAAVQLPCVISFTLETNGRLATGMSLGEAIEATDAAAHALPAYYMINCAHPSHFINELAGSRHAAWTARVRGIRANASCKSHAELDESTELDSGNPEELAIENQRLKALFPNLNVFGGCCGTDERHVSEMVKALLAAPV